MKRHEFSLRLRIVGWLLVPLALMSLLSTWQTYDNAHVLANLAYDRTLQASVRSIAERVRVSDGQVQVDIPLAALEMFEPQFQDRVFYRVSLPRGRVLTGYADLPAPPPDQAVRGEIFYFDAEYHGEPVRFAAFYQSLYDPAVQGALLVQVGETLHSRQQLTHSILWDALSSRLALACLACLAALAALQRGMRPVLRLRDAILQRDATSLTPLPEHAVPSELSPLVAALNQYMHRLSAQLGLQQRFIADASHQLRTPLTLLNTQAEFALRQTDPVALREVVTALHAHTGQTIRLANQLLSLSRLEPGNRHLPGERLELVAMVRELALEMAPLARARQQDLALEAEVAPAWIVGQALYVHELLVNLTDNAIRYTALRRADHPGGDWHRPGLAAQCGRQRSRHCHQRARAGVRAILPGAGPEPGNRLRPGPGDCGRERTGLARTDSAQPRPSGRGFARNGFFAGSRAGLRLNAPQIGLVAGLIRE